MAHTFTSPLCLNSANAGLCSSEVTHRVVSCPHRMDDIQLCKDIMDLKQELQNLVAIPGNMFDHILCEPLPGLLSCPLDLWDWDERVCLIS